MLDASRPLCRLLFMLSALKTGLVLAIPLCLTACLGTSPGPPPVPMRETWSAAADEGPLPVAGWVKDFSPSKGLEALMAEAVTRNFDLKAVAARMKAARARSIVDRSPIFPRISTSFQPSRTQRGTTTNNANVRSGATAAERSTIATQSSTSADIRNNFDLALDASWEVDLWGQLRNDYRASLSDAEAARFDYYAARLSLAANTAKGWFAAIEAQQQLELARETLESFEESLVIVEETFERGIEGEGQADPALDVRLTRANVAGARSRVKDSERNLDAATRSLEVLLGRYPSDGIKIISTLPSVKKDIPAGLPSELLVRRPDIRAAEFRLFGSGERVKAAKKAFLPSLRLTGSRGFQSDDLADLLRPEAIVWNVAGNLTQPLFEGARLAGELQIADANREEAVNLYAQTILVAFREVETALAAEAYLADQEAALSEAARESKEAEELALQQYGRGLVDIITVLEAQRRSFDSASTLITLRILRLQNRIDLYLALGGDFSSELKAEDFPVKIASRAQMTNAARRDKRWPTSNKKRP